MSEDIDAYDKEATKARKRYRRIISKLPDWIIETLDMRKVDKKVTQHYRFRTVYTDFKYCSHMNMTGGSSVFPISKDRYLLISHFGSCWWMWADGMQSEWCNDE